MMTVRQIKSDDWQLVKLLRLRALAEAPNAFAETLAEMEAMPDSFWQNRTQRNSEGKDSIGAIAFEGDNPVGMAVGLRCPDHIDKVRLVAMWVAPEYRGSGIAKSLVGFVGNWARESGVMVLHVDVRESNPRAEAFYRKIGFDLLPDGPPKTQNTAGRKISMQMKLIPAE